MGQTPRKVKYSTILRLLKRKPIVTFLGLNFTFMALLILVDLLFLGSLSINEIPKVDFELINSEGKEMTAEILDIQTQYNISINGVHPTIIEYKYLQNGKEVESKYQVLEERKLEKLEIGGSIQIKDLEEQSIIVNMEPYEFLSGGLLAVLIPFLLIGLSFLTYTFLYLKKRVHLYKYGIITQGKILSMMPKSGLPITNIGQGIIVHYEYDSQQNNKQIGESFASDFSILSDKKKGDFIPIFVSRTNDKTSCIVPKLESFRNNWNIEFD